MLGALFTCKLNLYNKGGNNMQTTQKRELSMQQCHENLSLLAAWLRLLYTATLAMSIGYLL